MSNLLFFCPVALLLLTFKPYLHEFHASKCLIEYQAEEKTVQISLHLFIDDVEEALRRKGADKLFLCTEKESKQAEVYLERYLRQNLQLKLDGRERPFRFLGKEAADDWMGMWCYFEIGEVAPFQELIIDNTLLTEVFSDQKNLVSIVGPDHKKSSLLFHKQKTQQRVAF
ncbi:MAG: hypothetical protein HUU01_20865 [Saprospiraceae bacterium]|nr:hypothetical protein [Saprospiraceae bacterium]